MSYAAGCFQFSSEWVHIFPLFPPFFSPFFFLSLSNVNDICRDEQVCVQGCFKRPLRFDVVFGGQVMGSPIVFWSCFFFGLFHFFEDTSSLPH